MNRPKRCAHKTLVTTWNLIPWDKVYKRVTENSGKNTPGVDGVLWKSPRLKLLAANSLARKEYIVKPLRRVHIRKRHGGTRPLGIPTMKDRAMQALFLSALDPVSETTADFSSYGFRRKRSCHDAVERCYIHLARNDSATWILEGDIKGCFDNISHEWIINNILIDKLIVTKWLKAGFIDKTRLFPTEAGTPQGGIISPTLANMVLDGLEAAIYKSVNTRTRKHDGCRRNFHKIHFARSVDDFIVMRSSKGILRSVAYRYFSNLDRFIWFYLWKWAKRRHAKKGLRWITSNYFKRVGSRKWTFFGTFENGTEILLKYASDTHIIRHVLINGKANPYCSLWDKYYLRRYARIMAA